MSDFVKDFLVEFAKNNPDASNADVLREAARYLNVAKPSKKKLASQVQRDGLGRQESLALSCNPDEAKKFNDDAKKHGFTAVEFKPDGTCLIPSVGKERQKYIKHRGYFDRGE